MLYTKGTQEVNGAIPFLVGFPISYQRSYLCYSKFDGSIRGVEISHLDI